MPLLHALHDTLICITLLPYVFFILFFCFASSFFPLHTRKQDLLLLLCLNRYCCYNPVDHPLLLLLPLPFPLVQEDTHNFHRFPT